jgi:hypothetical protein
MIQYFISVGKPMLVHKLESTALGHSSRFPPPPARFQVLPPMEPGTFNGGTQQGTSGVENKPHKLVVLGSNPSPANQCRPENRRRMGKVTVIVTFRAPFLLA